MCRVPSYLDQKTNKKKVMMQKKQRFAIKSLYKQEKVDEHNVSPEEKLK